MRKSYLGVFLLGFVLGGVAISVAVMLRLPWRWMSPESAGFTVGADTPAGGVLSQPSPPGVIGAGMPTERPLTGSPFRMEVSFSPATPAAGEEVEISVQIKSETAPHARVVVFFLIDGEKVQTLSGVIPPYQAEFATYTWKAIVGPHILRVELASAVGVQFNSWEKTVVVKEKAL